MPLTDSLFDEQCSPTELGSAVPSFDELTEATWRRMLRRRSRKVSVTLLSLALGSFILGRLKANSTSSVGYIELDRISGMLGPEGAVALTWLAVALATTSLIVLVIWMPLRDMYLRRKHMRRTATDEQ